MKDRRITIKYGIRLFLFITVIFLCELTGTRNVQARTRNENICSLTIGVKNLFEMAKKSANGSVQIQDGMGGTATYDRKTNKLVLENFTLKENSNSLAIVAYEMGDLIIELKGTNHIYADYSKAVSMYPFSIYAENCNIALTGNGSFVANAGMRLGDECSITDCNIKLLDIPQGVLGGQCEINNAKMEVVVTSDNPANHVAGMSFDKLKVRNSIIKLTVPPGQKGGDGRDAYVSCALSVDYDNGLADLGSDMVVTDFEGNTLTAHKFKDYGKVFVYIYSSGNWKYYYSDYDGMYDYGIIRDNTDNGARYVLIKSANKEASVNLENRIEKLTTLDMNTDAYGKELLACEEDLKRLSEEAKKLVANQMQLQKAREEYEENNQKKAQEVEKKITEIGEVTEKSQAKIEEAQKAYESLTQDQKDRVGNKELLTNATAKYKELIEEKKLQEEREAAIKKDKEEAKNPTKGKEDSNKSESKETISNKIKKNKITSVKSKKKKQVTLKWKKDKTCKGYQISYSTDKKFKKNKKTKTIKNCNTTKLTLTKLKSKKTYYVRIRAYQTINKKTCYGVWSNVKKIKVK